MSMRIQTNISAMNASRNLGITQNQLDGSIAKLSSGFRINRAADDAAGLGIANRFRSDVRALSQASRNADQANSLLQIAEGATSSVQTMLERMKELGIQAASDNVTTAGRSAIDTEFQSLKTEIDRIVATTKFQGKTLLDGSFGFSVSADPTVSTVFKAGTVVNDVVQAGAKAGDVTLSNSAAGKLMMTDGTVTETVSVAASGKQNVLFSKFGLTVSLGNAYDNTSGSNDVGNGVIHVASGTGGGSFMVGASGAYTSDDLLTLSSMDVSSSTGLSLGSVALDTTANAKSALSAIDSAIDHVSGVLGDIGAAQNRIENTQANLKVGINNISAAESVVRDLDMAEEMTKFSKNQVLAQAGTAMLAQANQAPSSILKLLQ